MLHEWKYFQKKLMKRGYLRMVHAVTRHTAKMGEDRGNPLQVEQEEKKKSKLWSSHVRAMKCRVFGILKLYWMIV